MFMIELICNVYVLSDELSYVLDTDIHIHRS